MQEGKNIHYIPKSIGSNARSILCFHSISDSNERFDDFSNFHEYKS